jgi:hypothetical protein
MALAGCATFDQMPMTCATDTLAEQKGGNHANQSATAVFRFH